MPTRRDQPVRSAAVSLDIWGTLLGSDPAFKPARNTMLRDTLAPEVPSDVFDAAMREADRAVDEQVVADGVDVGFVGRVETTLRRLGIPYGSAAERAPELMAHQADLAEAHPPRPLHPRLPAAVAALPVPVMLTSNTGMLPGELMRKLLVLAGFGGLPGVFSNEVGMAKPRREIFAAVCSQLHVAPAQVLHVGDNPIADVAGAQAAGMHAVLVRPDGQSTLTALRDASWR